MTEVTARPSEHAEPTVRTAAGSVRGRWEHDVVVFRGIPFAQPPIGTARFAAPQPVAKWDGVRDAFEFGPPPPQETSFGNRSGTVALPDGDDWLTVNVWTPDPDPAACRPVLVWIYGGAYKLGFSGSPGYDAQHIARDGDLVVVTLNYRVGIEGFARIDGAPANRGLLDQVAALEWVRENITAFGGDPDQVTVCGESAGAGSIAALLAMPRAAGLFRQAILQSMPGTFFSDELGTDIARAIAAHVGLRPTVADLSGVDPRQLTDAGAEVGASMRQYERWGAVAHTITAFSPVVDGEVLPKAPWQALAGGSARDVTVVIGHNRDEFRLFLALGGQLGTIDDTQAADALQVFGPGSDGADAYRTAFPCAGPEELFELVQTDWLFRMPALHLADAQAAGGGRAYMYELTWHAPGNGGVLRACHGLDGPLLFAAFGAQLGPLLLGPEPSAEARELSAYIRARWSGFARTGEPGWAAYDPEQRLTHILDVHPSVAPYPEETSRSLWRDHVFSALPLRGQR
ncbi:carboxylesterase/lipase family protein [Nocardia sp. NPDC050408]|uniref:carboxylesterase/lipase family protein n=1 Tax=Nocardia sp. NPDC050408 TaxID=3364319 RepID=UPI0037BA5EF6